MKIAINARHLQKDNLEGVGWYTYEMVKYWAFSHPDDLFYLLFDRPYAKEFVFSSNIIPIILSPQARHPLLFIWWFEYSVPRALKRINPDVYFSPDGFMPLTMQIPAVITIHDVAHQAYPSHIPPVMRWYYRFFVPRFIQRAHTVVTVSKFSKEEIIKYYSVSPAKIKVIYNGCREVFKPAATFKDLDIQKIIGFNAPYIIYVGSIHPRKNLSALLSAFELLKKRTALPHHLLIVGRLAWKSLEVTKFLHVTPYADQITMLQQLPDKTLAALVAHAEVLVYPSMYEGFGFPVLEGMQAEIPIIAARSSSLPEVGGEAVLYFDPNQPEDLFTRLYEVLTDADLCQNLKEKGKIQRTKFDWMKSSLQLYRILNPKYQ